MTELNSVRFALMQEREAKKQLEYLVEAKTLELYEVNKVLTDTNCVLEKRIGYRTYELQRSLLQQKLLAEISCSLNLLEDFDGQIREALRKMGEHAELDRIYIFETDLKAQRVVNKFAWCKSTVTIDTDNFEQALLEAIPCCKEHLSSGQRVIASHLSALPEVCADVFKSQGVRSVMIIPLFIRNEFYGFIGFDTCTKYKDWDESEINLLQTVSNLIGHAYEREITKCELIAAKEQAEAAARAKTEFLSTMSHEIRTPMNAVIGLSHLLMQDEPKPEQINNLKTLKFASENLFSLINDVLDLNKIDAGRIEFEQADFNFDTLLGGLEHSFALTAKKNNTRFIIEKSADVPRSLIGDPTRLTQVLTNLVSNALKFTKDGLVTLKINLLEQNSETTQLAFEVSDTGIGISADKLETIFEPFAQAETNTTRMFGGTGLGLSIIRKLLALQNSDIQVKSTPGEGTIFSFDLSFGTNQTTIQPTLPAPVTRDDLKGLRVLLVEDTDINVTVATQFLEKWGVTIELAENGKIAVQKATKQLFDLILMDLQMPVMNGFEATKAIRQFGGKYADVPIIALTASAELAVRREALEYNMNDYIAKPFYPKELYEKIRKNIPEQPLK